MRSCDWVISIIVQVLPATSKSFRCIWIFLTLSTLTIYVHWTIMSPRFVMGAFEINVRECTIVGLDRHQCLILMREALQCEDRSGACCNHYRTLGGDRTWLLCRECLLLLPLHCLRHKLSWRFESFKMLKSLELIRVFSSFCLTITMLWGSVVDQMTTIYNGNVDKIT